MRQVAGQVAHGARCLSNVAYIVDDLSRAPATLADAPPGARAGSLPHNPDCHFTLEHKSSILCMLRELNESGKSAAMARQGPRQMPAKAGHRSRT